MKTISRICAMASAAGLLTALSACAGSGLIKVTHSDTPYSGGYQTASSTSTVAKAQPVVHQAKSNEVQVAVMAATPTQPAPRRSVFIHR